MHETSLLPVTSPERSEWRLLSEVLGLQCRLTPPADSVQAAVTLRDAFDAAADDPLKLATAVALQERPEYAAAISVEIEKALATVDFRVLLSKRLVGRWDPAVESAAAFVRTNVVELWPSLAEAWPDAAPEDALLPEELDFGFLKSRLDVRTKQLQQAEKDTAGWRRLLEEVDSLHHEAVTRLRLEVATEYRVPRGWKAKLDPSQAHSHSRPEFDFFALVNPGRASEREGSVPGQIRNKAVDLLNDLSGRFTDEDYSVILDGLMEDWDPAVESLFGRFSELVETALTLRAEIVFAERCEKEFPLVHQRQRYDDFVRMVGYAETHRFADRADPFGLNVLTANLNIELVNLWRGTAVPGDLSYATRRDDYTLFCSALGADTENSLRNEELFVAIRDTIRAWILKASRYNTGMLLALLDTYDPAKDGLFTRLIVSKFRGTLPSPDKPVAATSGSAELIH